MKVVKFETWQCSRKQHLFDEARQGKSPMEWDVVILRLTTDTGIVGEASAFAARSRTITTAFLMEIIAPVVLGRDVTDREKIWQELQTIDRHGTFFPVFLPGPVDVALWDIAAKAAGLPLFRYLGACRTELPVYASSIFLPNTEAYIKDAKSYVQRGIKAYKAHVPGPWKVDMEVHRALRSELGDDIVLMSDPVAEYPLEIAIRVGRDLEKLNYHWFEEPFRDFELAKYAKLCAALDIPIAATETTRGAHWGVAQAIKYDAADIIRADVSWKPGVTGIMKIAHLAEANGLQCEPHTTMMGFMDMANLHVSCAIKNCEYFELILPDDIYRFPMKDPWPIDENGMIHVPEGPGLGVQLDWDAIDNTTVGHQVKTSS